MKKLIIFGYYSSRNGNIDEIILPMTSFEPKRNGYFCGHIETEDGSKIKGELCDFWGISDIEGIITENGLEFTKNYRNPKPVGAFIDIKYELRKNEFGTFIGTWKSYAINGTTWCAVLPTNY